MIWLILRFVFPCFLQEMVSVAVQSVQDVKNIVKDSNKNDGNGLVHDNGYDPYKVFVSVLFVVLQCKNVSSLLLYLSHCMIFCASVKVHSSSPLRENCWTSKMRHRKRFCKKISLFLFLRRCSQNKTV